MLSLWVRRRQLASVPRDALNRHSPSLGRQRTPNQARYADNKTSLPDPQLLSPFSLGLFERRQSTELTKRAVVGATALPLGPSLPFTLISADFQHHVQQTISHIPTPLQSTCGVSKPETRQEVWGSQGRNDTSPVGRQFRAQAGILENAEMIAHISIGASRRGVLGPPESTFPLPSSIYYRTVLRHVRVNRAAADANATALAGARTTSTTIPVLWPGNRPGLVVPSRLSESSRFCRSTASLLGFLPSLPGRRGC